jgi:hypothetical protein
MKISKNTQKLADELVQFSASKIKNIDDLALLIEIGSAAENEAKFSDIQFTAKYLNGLGKILKTNITAAANPEGNGKSVSAEEARVKIMDEFRSHMQKLSSELADYLKGTDEETKKNFSAKEK